MPGYLAAIAYSVVAAIVLAHPAPARLGADPDRPPRRGRLDLGPVAAAYGARPGPARRRHELVLAHAGHWLTTVGFAAAPLTVIAGVVAIALAERRRGRGPEPR